MKEAGETFFAPQHPVVSVLPTLFPARRWRCRFAQHNCDQKSLMTQPLPQSIDDTLQLLSSGSYVADRALATVLYLALKMQRPLFLEGEAGVGKTEIAKVLSQALGRPLIRLQCYEGLDVASSVYEWNYAALST